MPNVDGKSLSPDEAMLLGLCPECGTPLIPRTARAHAESHWGSDPDATRLSEEGRRRFKLILDFAAARQVDRPALEKSQRATSDRPDRWHEFRDLFHKWHRWT